MWLRTLSSPAFSWLFLMFLIIFWFAAAAVAVAAIAVVVAHYNSSHFRRTFHSFKLIFLIANEIMLSANRIKTEFKTDQKLFCTIFKYENRLIEIYLQFLHLPPFGLDARVYCSFFLSPIFSLR